MTGSSPRARGTRGRGTRVSCRITVHPRERGEHLPVGEAGRRPGGSSPRARGTLEAEPVPLMLIRFIPASAGNTSVSSSGNRSSTGSSPRARGTPEHAVRAVGVRRFIPASAGNTWPGAWRKCRGSVHPRERGEHVDQAALQTVENGSSPRARGTHAVHALGLEHDRFIPASAGNTTTAPPTHRTSPVHPRERGEHERPPPRG